MLPFTLTPRTLRCLGQIEALRDTLDRVGPLPWLWLGRTTSAPSG